MYRKKDWMDVKSLRAQGMSYMEIGMLLGMDRRTAKKLCEMEEVPGPQVRKRTSKADDYEEIIGAWLEARPKMKATLIYERLKPLGYEGSYSPVKRKVAAMKETLAKRGTVRFETLPGYQAQVDFGKANVKFLSGVERVELLVFLLGFSRWRRTVVCPDETRQSLMAGLSDSFLQISGVCQELLLDNMKPVVTRPRSADEPAVLTDEWLRFCAHYGTTTRACWPYRAQTKGKVERPIGVVKSFIYASTFLDLEHLEGELSRVDEAYNARPHSTTGMPPAERLEIERPYLLPLPPEPFAYAVTHSRKVSRDLLVSFEGNLYSAPAAFALREVKLRATPQEVHLYSREGALLASHARRERGSGAKILNPEHYQGVPGAKQAFDHLRRLEEMGLSPFCV